MIFLVVSTYFLSRKQEEYVEQNREAVAQLNDEVLESIEGIRVMRAYSRPVSYTHLDVYKRQGPTQQYEGD